MRQEIGSDDRDLGVAGDEQNLQLGAMLPREFGELPPIHVRQPDIGDKQVDRLDRLKRGNCVARVRRRKVEIPKLFQGFRYQLAYGRVILDHKHGVSPRPRARANSAPSRSAARLHRWLGANKA